MFTAANGDRESSPNIVVVITDGGSNDKYKTIEEAFKVVTNLNYKVSA